MKLGKRVANSYLLFFSLIIIGCGGAEVPNSPIQQTATSQSKEEIVKIQEILDNLTEIKTKLEKLEKTGSTTTKKTEPKKTEPAVVKTTTDTKTGSTTSTTKPAETPPASTSGVSQGRKLLDKVVSTFKAANGIDMVYDKYEKNPTSGKVRDTGTHLWAKNPDTILIELTRNPDDKGKEGTKIKYNVNETKAKVRSTGIASLATLTLELTDERLVSPNGYLLNQADILSLIKRVESSSYTADLTGKTTLNGTEIFILKVKAKSSNSMDSKIDYENIGFNSKDFTIRLWEVFTKGDEKPFIKVSVNKIDYLDTITESQLKL